MLIEEARGIETLTCTYCRRPVCLGQRESDGTCAPTIRVGWCCEWCGAVHHDPRARPVSTKQTKRNHPMSEGPTHE
jgi:hypothetical protein